MSAQLAHTALGLFCYSIDCYLEEGPEGVGSNLISHPHCLKIPISSDQSPIQKTSQCCAYQFFSLRTNKITSS